MQEIWKPVAGYKGLYEVSNMGNFRKLCLNGTIKVLKTTKNNWGYYTIGLQRKGGINRERLTLSTALYSILYFT